jgi:prepilin-type N-terminal cleavage/methylation domain-containing protein
MKSALPKSAARSAFTLVEMLVVIAIVGILVAISLPTVKSMRGQDATLATTRQLLDDFTRARQYAIAQRTTVYMVFCPQNFWLDARYAPLPASEKNKAQRLYDKQLNAYNFVTLRSIGDQPGRSTVRYLGAWRSLPEGAIIAPFKFYNARNVSTPIYDPPQSAPSINTLPNERIFNVNGFDYTTEVPFPSEDAAVIGGPYVTLPYIAFNHLGQVISGENELIPLARGNVSYARDPNTKTALAAPPTLSEQPPGSSSNTFMLVNIDWLTGRSRLEKQEYK